MKIVENLIPKAWQQDLFVSISKLPYIYLPATAVIDGDRFQHGVDYFLDENTVDTVQFTHVSDYGTTSYKDLRPLVYMLQEHLDKKIISTFRIKTNCLVQNVNFGMNNYNIAHTDSSIPSRNFISVLYYVNDSDGDTFFFNEDCKNKFDKLTVCNRVKPEMGKVVIFPSTQFHASSNPINSLSRFVVNFMIEVEND